MIRSIKVKKGSLEEEILLFSQIDSTQKFNILFGGNGVGKTTLLKGIEKGTLDLEFNRSTKILKYVNSEDNIRKLGDTLNHFYKEKTKIELTGDELYERYHANKLSEGQSIIYSFIRFLDKVEDIIRNNDDDIVLILDEIDSGLSCENINMIMHLLINLIDNHSGRDIQIFISSNNYHFTYVVKVVLNMYTGKYQKIDNYEEYYQLLADNMVKLGKKRELDFL